jgi:tRNA A-37 threonylcarbamoyl transferase component Bud32
MHKLLKKPEFDGKRALSRNTNPALDRFVSINGRRVRFGSISPLLEKRGVTEFHFNYSTSGVHRSNYVVGKYRGKDIGIRFGRPPWLYEREAEALERFSHPGIPKCHGIGQLPGWANDAGFMVLQHLPGAVLSDAVDFSSPASRKRSAAILSGIVDTLDHIHSEGVVHQDITKDHVLVDGSNISFIDFHLWDSSRDRHPVIDFCGSDVLPTIMETPELAAEAAGEWRPRGYGRMLRSLVPAHEKGDFFVELRRLVIALSDVQTQAVTHKTRDEISKKIKDTLKPLSVG